MYQPLAPCPACSRHVMTTERTCPFCKSELPESIASAALPGTTGRLSRAAAFAFTASLAVTGATGAGTGCSSGGARPASDASATNDGPNDEGGQQPVYGAPAYGQPFVDSGAPDDSG